MKWQAVWQRLLDMYAVLVGREASATEHLREQVRPKVRTLAENFAEYKQLNKELRAAYDEQVNRLKAENAELREVLRKHGYKGTRYAVKKDDD